MDFENSSIPSSQQKPGRKKIPNSRVKTDRKPGGQPGHAGHRRKLHAVTETHEIPAPAKYLDKENYYETGKIIRKQKVVILMSVAVMEYTTKEYRDKRTVIVRFYPLSSSYQRHLKTRKSGAHHPP